MTLPSALQARWNALSRREQRALQAALALLLAALLWWVALAPALATLRAAERQALALEAQWQQMRRLQAQAQTLQAQPRITLSESQRLLEASVKPLGSTAQLSVTGERATLTLKGASADALAQWLLQARLNARARPSEARLQRSASGGWDGSLVLNLSAR